MDTFDAIRKRHSYREGFKDIDIPEDDLREIVQAGISAPSGKNEQTTTFVIINDSELLEEIGGMHRMEAMREARAMIACIVDVDPEPIYEGEEFQVEDCAASVENMLLAITALGYASVWIDGWLRIEGNAGKIGALLGLPPGKIIRVLLPIGVPEEEISQKEKKPFDERAWFNEYKSCK